MAFNPELGSTSPAVLLDNAERLDKLVNGPAADVPDRGGDPLYSWRQMMAKNDEIRQNIIPLSKQYMTIEAAQADIANIPEGSTTYVRSLNDALLAYEVKNVAGTLQATGRVMGGNAALMAPNLITNSRASDTEQLPVLFSFGATKWSTPGSQMAALGAVQSVLCTPRASTSDPAVNWLFQHDISFVGGGSFIATEFLFRGNTDLIFTRVVPDAAATRLSQNVVDLVCSGMIQILTFQINFCSSEVFCHVCCVVQT